MGLHMLLATIGAIPAKSQHCFLKRFARDFLSKIGGAISRHRPDLLCKEPSLKDPSAVCILLIAPCDQRSLFVSGEFNANNIILSACNVRFLLVL